MYTTLLAIHVVAGSLALLAAAGAMAFDKGGRAHAVTGRVFALGMTVIFLTAVPMTLLKPNLFLLLVALFNFYLTATGWLRATNRRGIPTRAEWAIAATMAVVAVGMGARGAVMLAGGASMGVVLVAFALIGGGFAARDLVGLRRRRFRGTERIVSHLNRMLGGTIGAITAVVVTTVRVEPAFLLWLLPTAVMVPVIALWSRRVRRGDGRARAVRPAAAAPREAAYAETGPRA